MSLMPVTDSREMTGLTGAIPVAATARAGWAAEAEAHTRDWVRRLGLVRSAAARRHFDAISGGALAASVYPDARPGTRQTLTDWFSWLFILDDQCDEGQLGRDPAALDILLLPLRAALVGSGGAEHPLAAALGSIRARIEPGGPADWWHRFRGHVLEYLDGCRWEAANRAAGRVPSLAEYPARRRAAGAILPSLDLIEFGGGRYLPAPVRQLPAYAAAVRAAADVVCWTDDIATADKEAARGDLHNLVIVLDAERGCGAAAATAEAARMLHTRLADFEAAEAAVGVATAGDDALVRAARHNLAGLRTWMRGHLDWGLDTARYHEVERLPGVPDYIEDLSYTTPG
jgi:terpene synthase-like protein